MAKSIRPDWLRLAVSVWIAAVVSMTLAGSAQAITSDAFTYSPSRQGYFSIHPMALAPNETAAADNYYTGYFPPYLKANGTRCFNTGVNLPDGATVTKVAVWTTAAVSNNNFVYLARVALSSGSASFLVSEGLTGETGARREQSYLVPATSQRIINNRSYAYGFGVCLGDADHFNGARIDYTYGNAGE